MCSFAQRNPIFKLRCTQVRNRAPFTSQSWTPCADAFPSTATFRSSLPLSDELTRSGLRDPLTGWVHCGTWARQFPSPLPTRTSKVAHLNRDSLCGSKTPRRSRVDFGASDASLRGAKVPAIANWTPSSLTRAALRGGIRLRSRRTVTRSCGGPLRGTHGCPCQRQHPAAVGPSEQEV